MEQPDGYEWPYLLLDWPEGDWVGKYVLHVPVEHGSLITVCGMDIFSDLDVYLPHDDMAEDALCPMCKTAWTVLKRETEASTS